jgi:hypothetical protein
VKERVQGIGEDFKDSPGEHGRTDVDTEEKDNQQNEQVVRAGQRSKPGDHAQGKTQGDLSWICFGMHHPDQANDRLYHGINLIYVEMDFA